VNGVAIEKGVAFPVCISVNEIVCNQSPLASEELVSKHTFYNNNIRVHVLVEEGYMKNV